MAVTMNSRLFLERAGLRPTYRRPCPTMVPGDSEVHAYPVDTPLPRAASVRDGFPAPDRSQTLNDPWPFG